VTDVVTLQLPRNRELFGVAHLVLGGLAARLDLTVDVLDDISTALDELLRRRERTDDVTVSVRIEETALLTVVGPFDDVAEELESPDEGLGLRRVLETVVDKVDVQKRDGRQWVELRKELERA
jgi:anti-sigma regulatory factor (Ser/Thr protein kinase)